MLSLQGSKYVQIDDKVTTQYIKKLEKMEIMNQSIVMKDKKDIIVEN